MRAIPWVVMNIRLKDHLCFRLYVASRLIIQGYGEALEPLGLTYPKYLVLLALQEENGQTVNAIGKLLSLDSGTLSPLLKSLDKQGFVQRTRLAEDERTVVNLITPAGRTACTKAKKIAVSLFKETGMKENAFVRLRSDMDDYVTRCKKILEERKTTFKQIIKKESVWKIKTGRSRTNSPVTRSH